MIPFPFQIFHITNKLTHSIAPNMFSATGLILQSIFEQFFATKTGLSLGSSLQ